MQDAASKDTRAAEAGEGTNDPKGKPLVPVLDHLPPRFRSVGLHLVITITLTDCLCHRKLTLQC